MRYLTAGESHGPCLTAIIEGLPSGLAISKEQIDGELARRQQGYGRGGRMSIEQDRVNVLSGVRFGETISSPLTLQIQNKDWENWQDRMSAFGPPHGEKVTKVRPGHADLPGCLAYRREDARDILERASARETTTRVAVGAVAKQLLEAVGIHVSGRVTNIGGIESAKEVALDHWQERLAQSQLACLDEEAEQQMIALIDKAKAEGDTLGGIFEVVVTGVPIGLGSHVHWEKKLDGRIANGLMSIQGIKGVEFGLGFGCALRPGSQVHDQIYHTPEQGYYRTTNNAGGIEGGYSNGEPIIVRAAMKPIPTLMKPLQTVDSKTKEPVLASTERSDVCAVPAALVVAEAAVAITLATVILERFGTYNMQDLKDSYQRYVDYIRGE